MQELVWSLTRTMFSEQVITPGKTRTSDLVWWWRQQVNDLGLGTWFQPDVDVQRKGRPPSRLGDDPVIERGDVLHCDVGITVARLNTDTQHDAYVLRDGETDAPAGLRQALANSNALQDIVMDEIRPGRTGNEILAAARVAHEGERHRRNRSTRIRSASTATAPDRSSASGTTRTASPAAATRR